jgi:serine/threonine protein phosphatase PrpC
VKSVLQLGRTQLALGAIGEAGGDGIAVALSRGGAPKPYTHTDPNEDCVLAARGARGWLVAAADGHWGVRASEIAAERLRDAHAGDWVDGPERSSDRWYQDVLYALVDLNDAILAAHDEEQQSRTTLAIALARPGESLLVAASVGDSHLFVATPEETHEVLANPRKFAALGGEKWTPSQMERAARFDVRPLGAVEALIAVTDGISEEGIGVAEPIGAVREALARARAGGALQRAATTARALVDAALAAHVAHEAGDNVSAAVAWPEP